MKVALRKRGKGLVAVPDTALPKLTTQQVRDTLERVRRHGAELVSCDRRAAVVYERYRVRTRLL